MVRWFDILTKLLKLATCQDLALHIVKSEFFTFEIRRYRWLPLWRVCEVWRSSINPRVWRGRTFSGGTTFQRERLYGFHRSHRRRCVFTHPLWLRRHDFNCIHRKYKVSTLTATHKVFILPFITQCYLIHSLSNFGRLSAQKCGPRDFAPQYHWIKLQVENSEKVIFVLWIYLVLEY